MLKKQLSKHLMSSIGVSLLAATLLFSTSLKANSKENKESLESTATEITHPTPIKFVEPKYPIKAARKKIEGYVMMRFDLNEKGQPINIEVIESSPKEVFDRSAKKALSQWQYDDAEVNGVSVKLEFNLEK